MTESVTTQSRLDELVDVQLGEMSDAELEKHIRSIQHTGIQRAARKAESKKPANAKQGRELKAVKDLRQKMEANGKTPAEIEAAVTILKTTLGNMK